MEQKNIYNNFINDFSKVLYGLTNNREFSNVVFLCIGTDRITGDSFGPLVGYKLNSLFYNDNKIQILGNLNDLVCSSNINETINNINRNYSNPFIIAVDSAISECNRPGSIIVSDGGVTLGSGVNRQVARIGDMSVKGVVATNLNNPRFNMKLLQNVRLNLVMNMADVVSKGIYSVVEIT